MVSPTLALVPTPLERRRLGALEARAAGDPAVVLTTCGFGPVAAAARTASLLAAHAPARVLLVGIAGTYDPGVLALGAATTFAEVAQADLGAGRGDGFRSSADLGLPQWAGEPGDGTPAEPVHDRLPLTPGPDPAPLLVTAATASGDAAHAAERAAAHAGAAAEDMEAFGVALACHLAGVPLTVVRGISNRAGDRDHARWVLVDALAAAEALALALLDR